MASDAYRDRLGALRASVSDKRGTVRPPHEFLTLVRRLLLPPTLIAAIESCARELSPDARTSRELSQVDAALDRLARNYEEALSVLRAAAPDSAPPAPAFPPELGTGNPNIDGLEELLTEIDGVRELWGTQGGVGVRFASGAVQFFLALHSLGPDLVGRLRVAVPRKVPALAVRLEGTTDRFAGWLGMSREATLGVRSFDEQFWIAGDERTARALLTPRLRTALRGLELRDPTFTVAGGVAEVGWRSSEATRRELLPAEARHACSEVVEIVSQAVGREPEKAPAEPEKESEASG